MKRILKISALILSFGVTFGSLASCAQRSSSSEPSSEDSAQNSSSSGETSKQSVSDAVKLLEESPYTSEKLTANYGLSDAKNVGVNKDKTEESLYHSKADGEFASGKVFSFDSYSGSDDEKINSAIAAAKAANEDGSEVKIKFPSREIALTSTVEISGFDGLYLEGGEDTVLVTDCTSSGWISAISVSDCKNIRFNDLALDYKILPVITGVVTSSDEQALSVTMSIPESMQPSAAVLATNQKLGASLRSVIQFNRYTGAPEENGIVATYSDGVIDSCTFAGDDEVTVKFKSNYASSFVAPVKNAPFTLAFAMYDAAGVRFSGCENVYVEDFDLYTCPGMACTVTETTNFYANRFNFTLKDDDRKMTATADGFHISLCLGEVKITNCVLENTHDDALNIKSGYWYTLGSYDATERVFNFSKKTSASLMTEVGDTIELYSGETFEFLGSFSVTAVTGNANAFSVTVNKRISGNIDWSNAMMTNVSKVAKFTFSNNIVRNKRNRGILVQVRDALIENNAFLNVGHGSMQIASAMDVYNESTLPKDIVVRNNKLINNGYLLGQGLRGDISSFAIASSAVAAPSGTISGISVSNNYISNSGNAGVSLRGVGESSIQNNLFYNTARIYSSVLTECCIELENCTAVTISGNYNYNTNDSDTFAGIIPCGTTKTDEITLTGNTNLKYQEISGDVLNTAVSKVASGKITLDGNVSEWTEIGSSIAMNGASETTGNEFTHEMYKDVFDVRMCKIAWTDEGIYFAFDIFDNKLDFRTIANFWEGDGAEIFLSNITDMPNADFQLYRNDGDVMQLSVVPSWSVPFTFGEGRTNSKIVAGKNAIQVKASVKNDGYSGEVFLPFFLFEGTKATIDAGGKIAMGFVFMDADRDDLGRKRIQVSNCPHFVEAYKTKTAKMPVFTFVD